MARAVLSGRRGRTSLLVCVLAAACAQAADAAPGQCAPNPPPGAGAVTRPAYADLLRTVTTSAFYAELVRLHGAPRGCTAHASESDLTLRYSFAHRARLTVRVGPAIEFSEYRVELRAMSDAQALEFLKAEEREVYGASSCGIAWSAPPEVLPVADDGSRGVVYRGDTCNCQARVLRTKTAGVILILRSAC